MNYLTSRFNPEVPVGLCLHTRLILTLCEISPLWPFKINLSWQENDVWDGAEDGKVIKQSNNLLLTFSLFRHLSRSKHCINDLLLKFPSGRAEKLYAALLSKHVFVISCVVLLHLLLLLLLWLQCFQQERSSRCKPICLHLNYSTCQFLAGLSTRSAQLKIAASSEACMQRIHTHTCTQYTTF